MPFTLKNKISYMSFVAVIIALILAVIYIFNSASNKRAAKLHEETIKLSEKISESVELNINKRIFLFKSINGLSNIDKDIQKTFHSTVCNSFPDILLIRKFDSNSKQIFIVDNLNSATYIPDKIIIGKQLFSFDKKHIFVNLQTSDNGCMEICFDSQKILEQSTDALFGDYCVHLKHKDSKLLASIGKKSLENLDECKFAVTTTNQLDFIIAVAPGEKEIKEISYTPLSAMFIVAVIFCMGIALLGMYILQTTIQENENHAKQLQNLTGQALGKLETERTRISRILHDDIGHDLTMALMSFDFEFEEMLHEKDNFYNGIDHIQEGLRKIRQFCRSLQPPMIEDVGWEDVVIDLVDNTTSATGIIFKTKFAKHDIPLSKEYQTNIYRIIREAVTNIAKYADATIVEISSQIKKNNLVIIIKDNGSGFNVKQCVGKGIGLIGIKERCEKMNAKLVITSTPKDGTTIEISILKGENNNGCNTFGG